MAAPHVAPLALERAGLLRELGSLFRPRPAVYWLDLAASAGFGWGSFAAATQAGWPLRALLTCLSILALLRGALFIHELAHLRPRALPGFRVAWHVAFGIPLLLPSLTYEGSHGDHHRHRTFGTRADPEYAPIALWSRTRIAAFLLGAALVPPALALRWALAPISWVVPPLRRLLVERGSTLAINSAYRRPRPRGAEARRWLAQEAAAAAAVWGAVLALALGRLDPTWALQWLLVAAGVAFVNQLRTLAAHGYVEHEGELDEMQQLLDSRNLRGWPLLTALAVPLGLRYHALHHYLPTLPYHSLGRAHRELCARVSPDSAYHCCERAGLVAAVRELWDPPRRASEAGSRLRGASPPVARVLLGSRRVR